MMKFPGSKDDEKASELLASDHYRLISDLSNRDGKEMFARLKNRGDLMNHPKPDGEVWRTVGVWVEG